MFKSDASSLATELTEAGEQARQVAARALDESRAFASQAAGTVGDTMRDLRDGAADAARWGADSLTESATAAQRSLQQYARAARQHVSDEPFKSALIAAALGAAAATILLALMRRR